MNHYFSDDNAGLKSSEAEINYVFNFTRFVFATDSGVFAKGGVDAGTDVLLKSLPELQAGERVLDMGCGYGVAGVVLSKTYGAGIALTMSDVNGRALDLARRNLQKNNPAGAEAVRVVKSDGFAALGGQFDRIILNPPIHAGKPVIYKIYGDAREHLSPGGALYVVVRKKHGASSHRQKLEEIFGGVAVLHAKKGVFVFEAACGGCAPPHPAPAF